jgi:hypothetical protein
MSKEAPCDYCFHYGWECKHQTEPEIAPREYYLISGNPADGRNKRDLVAYVSVPAWAEDSIHVREVLDPDPYIAEIKRLELELDRKREETIREVCAYLETPGLTTSTAGGLWAPRFAEAIKRQFLAPKDADK